MDCSLPGSSIHGISQARTLECVAISFSMDLPDPGIEPVFSAWQGGFFTTEPPGRPKWLYSLFNSYLKVPIFYQTTVVKKVLIGRAVYLFLFLKKSVLHVFIVNISVKIITRNLLTSLTRKEQGTNEGHINDKKLKFYFPSAGL